MRKLILFLLLIVILWAWHNYNQQQNQVPEYIHRMDEMSDIISHEEGI